MWRLFVGAASVFLIFVVAPLPAFALEPVSLENAVPPEPNRADEPYTKQFSAAKAAHFLDSASIEWQKTWGCFTCHTNISYLIGRPAVPFRSPAEREVRKFAEELVSMRWEEVGSRFDAEVVATAVAMAINDASTTKKLHPLTRLSLDRMWLVQRPEGDWKWPIGCRWPPMESDDHYGVTFAAIGVGMAPDGYAKTPQAQAGLAKIRTYLKNNPPVDLHHRAMVLWASTYVDGLMTADERKACVAELIKAERPGGGWAFASLYPWKRGDDKEQDLETPDGYGTGFTLFVLRKAGVPLDEPAVRRGVAWLKKNQRASGRWFSRSLNKDNEHYISHAGSAYAVLALAECGELSATEVAAAGNEESAASNVVVRKAMPGATGGLTRDSDAVKAYLAEQQRRRDTRLAALRKRIDDDSRDPEKKGLVGVFTEQLADLERKPAEDVGFDPSYKYIPETGRLGYAKKVRLVDNTADGRSVLLIDNTTVVIGGLETKGWPSGKFFGIESAILVGAPRPDFVFRNQPKKCFDAGLVDLKAVLGAGPRKPIYSERKVSAPAKPVGLGAGLEVALWPGTPADDVGLPGKEEHYFELSLDGKPHTIAGRATTWLKDVTRPTIVVHRPPAEKNTGASMLICPGGGYHKLGWDVEGEEIAAWLNKHGITGIILKYRCPRRPGDVKGLPPDGPLKDAQRAVSLVRSKATEWKLDPKKIGMVGFSAGGHLVGATSTRFEQRTYAPIDDVDKVSCRPDFGVMCYSGYFQAADDGALSPTVRTPTSAPPLLFVHATDDPISSVEHSLAFFRALRRSGARTELHSYSAGGHGFGVRDLGLPVDAWKDRCLDWLRQEKLLASADAATLPADASAAPSAERRLTNRPKVPGVIRLNLRERRVDPAKADQVEVTERAVDWNVSETAIIVCDMWDDHHCKIAAQRVGAMAPRMNQVLTAARDRGVMIIFAPSETMNVYADTPYRRRMQQAKPAVPPKPIERRVTADEPREPRPLPLDTALDCDDETLGPVVRFHTRQHAGLDITGFDGISDDGREIYNFCEQEGIKNVVLMGVHTNYCILTRSFGVRQMVRLGRNVVLARDLTDALYDPREPPHVSHARGTELVVEHVERYWCPSVMSADLTKVVVGSDGPFEVPKSVQQKAK